jgi:hypothetical protein
MLWEMKPDSQNILVSGAIRRDQVDQMLQCLHFRDNTLLDGDGYFKVRPIINNLNKSGKWFLESGQYSVDEVMIPYFGRTDLSSTFMANQSATAIRLVSNV